MRYLPGIAFFGIIATATGLFWYGVWCLVGSTFGPALWEKIVWASGDPVMLAFIGAIVVLGFLYREVKKECDNERARRGV